MKRQTSFMSFKVVVMSCAAVVLMPAVLADETVQEMRKEQIICEIKSEAQLYNKALRALKRAFSRAKASGTPYYVSCKYSIKDNKAISASTEVHYADYRKKSDLQSVEFSPAQGKLDRVVEFVYKPKSETLAVIDRDPINVSKRISTRKVKIAI